MKLKRDADLLLEQEDKDDIDLDDDLDLDDDSLLDNSFDDPFSGMDDTSRIPLEKHKDLLKDLTNFAPFLTDIFNGWLGMSWSDTEKKFVRNELIEPTMNLFGATWCVGFLKIYARKQNIITHIGKDEYKYIIEDVIETVWMNLGTRSEEFGIKTSGDLLKVCVELQHSAELVLMGAGDGKYNKFMSSVSSYNYNSSIAPQKQDMGPVMKERKSPLQELKDTLFSRG